MSREGSNYIAAIFPSFFFSNDHFDETAPLFNTIMRLWYYDIIRTKRNVECEKNERNRRDTASANILYKCTKIQLHIARVLYIFTYVGTAFYNIIIHKCER